jgi:transaldolase
MSVIKISIYEIEDLIGSQKELFSVKVPMTKEGVEVCKQFLALNFIVKEGSEGKQ